MKKLVVGIVSAAALATVGMAAAATSMNASEQTFSNSAAGIYAGAGLGYGYVDQSAPTGTSVSKGSLSWDALFGYQFNPYVALEARYLDFGYATVKQAGFPNGKVDLYGLGADVKGILPVNNNLNVFGLAGILRMDGKVVYSGTTMTKNHAWTPDLGVGAGYTVMKNTTLTVEDVYAFKNTTNSIPAANAVLAGATYKFSL